MTCHTKEQLEELLFDVVNELNLSDMMLDKHGPHGTAPAILVREVLAQKDLQIKMLRQGFKEVGQPDPRDSRIASLEREVQSLRGSEERERGQKVAMVERCGGLEREVEHMASLYAGEGRKAMVLAEENDSLRAALTEAQLRADLLTDALIRAGWTDAEIGALIAPPARRAEARKCPRCDAPMIRKTSEYWWCSALEKQPDCAAQPAQPARCGFKLPLRAVNNGAPKIRIEDADGDTVAYVYYCNDDYGKQIKDTLAVVRAEAIVEACNGTAQPEAKV